MTVFHCAACGGALTGPLSRVPLPMERWLRPPHDSEPTAVTLMQPGDYAVDPEPYGSGGIRGTSLMAPGEVRARLVPAACEIGCLGIHGYRRPNMACVQCGAPIGSRVDDCQAWQEARLHPGAVRAERAEQDVPGREGEGGHGVRGVDEVRGRAPFEDGGAADWLWFGRLAIGAAGVLARSGGLPVRFGERAAPLRDFLSGALSGGASERLLKPSGTFAFCGLAGERPPEGASRSLALVPRGGRAPAGAEPVHLDGYVWAYLADDPARTARTRWRPGLAALSHREEPEHRASAAEFLALGRWPGRLDLRDVLAGMAATAGRAEPGLAALAAELGGRAHA